jgi:very-short-patch-repair endonuclease/predicted transcriptional regulator of viral defense system
MRPQSAPITVERRICAVTANTHAVITNEELCCLGLSQAAIQRRVTCGRLQVLYRGIYAVGPIVTAQGQWLAAVRAHGPNAVLSHRSAAVHWGILSWRTRQIEISFAGRSGRKARRGVTLHRPVRLCTDEMTEHERIPVTTPARTLLDLAAVLPRRALERAIDEAQRLRLHDEHALRRTLEANRGRRGASLLASVFDHHAAGSTLTRSELEELFLKLCVGHGLPRPRVNVQVGHYEVDFLWPEQSLIVETDGHASHGTRAAFERDRARDAHLTARGYRVMRFTYRQITAEPAKVASLIARLLRSPPPAPRSRA